MAPPASFRAIQPAPVIKGAKSGTPAASSAAHSSKSGWFSAKVLTKRIKAVTQACQTCRKNKAKAALRSRLEALEKLVGDLHFFSSCGKLFHIFSREQMEAYHRAVYGIDGPPDTTQKLAICCLSGLAAVGVQYNPSVFEKGIEKVFHDVSRRFFSEVIEEEPLATIKVCTLFAMYNILNKATVALAYVGYISGADDSDLEKLLPVAEQEQDSYSAELGELVQAEMTKISLLKAGILRNHLTVQELTALGMDGIIKELQDWHNQLPEPMKLRSLYRDDWGPLVRWSIYHLHLLYSGAFMLVYRRIAAHCVRLIRTRGGTAFTNPEPALLDLVEQGLTSARDTARIVSLLLGEQGVFKRCWIVM
ncbi:hypothetical protein N0V88_007482 [Collariella sp. IMI 366227]|nr:hypothetical protein N0V88_007482 [Collariella sp. IMI 366227]